MAGAGSGNVDSLQQGMLACHDTTTTAGSVQVLGFNVIFHQLLLLLLLLLSTQESDDIRCMAGSAVWMWSASM
jgi:hypothetical protein